MNCEAKIVDLIDESEKSIKLLAYVFTSNEIANALIAAKNRGVDVKIKAQGGDTANYKNSKIKKMRGQGIPIELVTDEGIFHHKVMIFDEAKMITGSFNYTWSAQNRNHENVLFLKDQEVIREYLENL